MFQDFALFPHRDVGDNVAVRAADARPVRAPARTARVAEVLELVGLPGAERRSVTQLSGGEQQRVALARALAPEPRLLMLDEPMGSLDRALRERLPIELRAIFLRLGLTVLYVTHDQEEAFSVADRVVILRAGRIEADGTPEDAVVAATQRLRGHVPGVPQRGTGRRCAMGSRRRRGATLPVPAGIPDGPATVVLRPGVAVAARRPGRSAASSPAAASRVTTRWWRSIRMPAAALRARRRRDGPRPEVRKPAWHVAVGMPRNGGRSAGSVTAGRPRSAGPRCQRQPSSGATYRRMLSRTWAL